MGHPLKNFLDRRKMPFVLDPNPFDEIPRHSIVYQELGLLCSLDSRFREVSVGDRTPVEALELFQRLRERCESVASILGAEGPLDPVRASPLRDAPDAGYQMDNRSLSAAIPQVWVIASMDDEQHHRARTEIERHELPNHATPATIHGDLL